MEGLVNYSSEDDQDDSPYISQADRGGGASSNSLNRGSTYGTSGRESYKNEDHNGGSRYKSTTYSSAYTNRSDAGSSSSHIRNSGDRDNRRESYGKSRDSNNANRRDDRTHDRNRYKNYKDKEYRRDRSRNDDNNRYSQRQSLTSNSSSYHKDRQSNNAPRDDYRMRHSDSSEYSRHNHRESNIDDRRRSGGNNIESRSRNNQRSYKPARNRSHSRSRSRSRSHSRSRSVSKERRDKLRQSRNSHERDNNDLIYRKSSSGHSSDSKRSEIVPLLSVQVSDAIVKQANIASANNTFLSSTSPVSNTSALSGPTAASSNIQLPSYYNPNVINPNKYAEQVQKRKLIWGSKKAEDTSSKWGNAQFSQDSDGKMASKFMRLMGIKSSTSTTSPDKPMEEQKKPIAPPDVKSREAMFSSMEQQYEVARQATHTMRGVGFGFGSQAKQY